MNVDWPRARLSEAPTRVNNRSTTPTTARRAGTNAPICASTTHSPARPDALLGAEYPGLVLLELRRHEPLRPGQGLAALVVDRHVLQMRACHFDVVAEDFVEADLERADPGALPLARLQPRDVGL